MSDCLFCKISSGEIPSKQAYSDALVYAFHDIAPKAPTHVLIIPRKHIPKLADAGPGDRELIGEVVTRATAIARDLGLEHYRLVANNGEGAGQTVFTCTFTCSAAGPWLGRQGRWGLSHCVSFLRQTQDKSHITSRRPARPGG